MSLTLTTQISLLTEGVSYYVGLIGMTTNFGFVVITVAQPVVVLLTPAPSLWNRMKGFTMRFVVELILGLTTNTWCMQAVYNRGRQDVQLCDSTSDPQPNEEQGVGRKHTS